MNCEKCGKEIDGSFGSGKFCSRVCANSRVFNEESKQKKSLSNKKRYKEKGAWGGLGNLTEEQKKKYTEDRRIYFKNELLSADFNSLSYGRKRKRVCLEQDNKCFECGLKEWRGKKLPLEIEHKDGNHSDNSRGNLIALCPNCHSLTLTWRGRNKARDSKWLSGPEIYALSQKGMNIHQILLQMGFAAKGDNYRRIYRILENFEEVPMSY